jgi:hypothetical protein
MARRTWLARKAHVAYLVQEEGSAVGHLELALAPGDGVGEGAFLVAEELALDEAVRDGRAVHLHEGACRTLAPPVDFARQDLLARAVLALI